MQKCTYVKTLPEYRLELRFSDGTAGVLSIEDRLFGPMFEPLKDPAVFAQVTVDEYGVVCWPNGADLDPEALHAKLRQAAQVA
jgi:hypothetical protein